MKLNAKRELQLNIFVAFLCQIAAFVANYYSKQAILAYMGKEYLGLQTVIGNFCDIYSLVFLAAGMVMLFRLSEPLANGDREKIATLNNYFDRVFRILVFVVVGIGAAATLVLLLSLNTSISALEAILIYWMYLAGTVIYFRFYGDFFFLMADQKRYMANPIIGLGDILALIIEIKVLKITGNYYLFLVVLFAKNVLEGAALRLLKNREFPYLTRDAVSLPDSERKDIKKDIKDMIVTRIGGLLLYNTDSIIISTVVNTAIAGCYSTYYFVVYGMQCIMGAVFDTLLPKIGQLNVKNTREKEYKLYLTVSALNVCVVAVCVAGLYLLIEDFIVLWMNDSILLDKRVVTILAVNFYISSIRASSTAFRQADGLFDKMSRVILFRGVFNIILSFALGFKFGILGILAATAVSDGLTVFWYEPKLMMDYYKKSMLTEVIYQIVGIGASIIAIYVGKTVIGVRSDVTWGAFLVKGMLIVGANLVWMAAIFGIIYFALKNRRNRDEG